MREYSMLFVRTEEHGKKNIETALQEGFDGKIECVTVDALFDGLRLLQERSGTPGQDLS